MDGITYSASSKIEKLSVVTMNGLIVNLHDKFIVQLFDYIFGFLQYLCPIK